MQRNGNDQAAQEWLAVEAFLEQIAKRLRQRDAVGIFEMMDDFAESLGKEDCGAGKVEDVFVCSAQAAETFDCRRRIAALRTDGRWNGNEAGPAVRAGGSVTPLENTRSTDNAGHRKKKVEDGIDHIALGKRKGRVEVYHQFEDYLE